MTLLQDLKYAFRISLRNPTFTAIAIGTVALAVGATSAMFSFFDGTVLNPLPYPESQRLVRLFERPPSGLNGNVSTLNYQDWQAESSVFENITARALWSATMITDSGPERIRAARVSPDFFDMYSMRPAIGRSFRSDEDQPGSDKVVLLSNALWQSRFGSDPAIVGRKVVLGI